MTNDLVCIVYYSNARSPFDTAALSQLLETSRRNNSACNVTGMLLFHDGNFIQALEGPRAEVQRVFERIKRDRSHGGIVAVGPMEIGQRYFPDWSMGVLTERFLTPTGRNTVGDFLRCKASADADPSSIAWRLLNCFREGAARST